MDLPFEVRSIIWEHLFPVQMDKHGNRKLIRINRVTPTATLKHVFVYRIRDTHDWDLETCTGLEINLMLCNRQISREVAQLVYGQQIFRFEGLNSIDTWRWLDRIGVLNTNCMRYVRFTKIALHNTRAEPGDEHRIRISKILGCLPQLRSLKCPAGMETLPEQNKMPGSKYSMIISMVSHMVHLEYLHLIATSHHLDILQHVTRDMPNLRHLVLKGPLHSGDNTQIKTLFEHIPRLRHLHLVGFLDECVQDDSWQHFFENIAPLECFEYKGRFLSKTKIKAFTTQHGKTLRHLKLCLDDDFLAQDARQYTLGLSLLFDNLPVLEVLQIRYWLLIVPVLFTILPPSLEALSTEIISREAQEVSHGLLDLDTRCPKLKYFRLLHHSQTHPLQCFGLDFHMAIDHLRSNGRIEVEPLMCITSDC